MTKKIDFQELAKNYGTSFKFTKPDDIVDGTYVKKLRLQLNYTQSYFAQVLGVTKKTIEKWEQGKNPVKGTAAALLYIIKEQPDVLKHLVFDDSNYAQAEQLTASVSNFSLTTDHDSTIKKKEPTVFTSVACAA